MALCYAEQPIHDFPNAYDADLYRERTVIERCFNKIKPLRCAATRYDKLLASFMGFVKITAMATRLK